MPSLNIPRDEGMGSDIQMPYKIALFIIVLLALSVSHAVEIWIKIFHLFRSYHGLYFWSLIAASVGIFFSALGYFVRNYGITEIVAVQIFFACSGGILMVTGQSIVMWSRLHLISPGKRDMWLLYMILLDCIVLQGGATTLFAGSNSAHPNGFLKIFKIWEPLQVTWFFVQESLISGIYIYRTAVLMRSSSTFRVTGTKFILYHLIAVNIIAICLDVTVIAFQWAGLYQIQTAWKTFAYAIKLRLEFSILNQLVDFTKAGFARNGQSSSHHILGSGDDSRHAARQSVGGSRFNTSTYSRMNDDTTVTELQCSRIMKKTEIDVVREVDDGERNSSTKELAVKSNSVC